MLLLAVLAIGTGSVLLLGYLLAALSLGVILFIKARKLTRRIGDARLGRPRLVSRLPVMSRSTNENPRRAA
jgi:hypothetical protein